MQRMMSKLGAVAGLSAVLALSGCISLGKKPPDQLLNLTATSPAPAGASASGSAQNAIAVMDVEAPQKIDVARVPVDTSGSTLAYLQDAQWVEKPARLFTRLLSDTLRARGNHLVVSGTDLEDAAATKLSGTLQAMDYDASSGAVVVRFDAVLQSKDGAIRSKRFEATVSGVAAQAVPVGAALNQAANEVATQVADWVG
jgi:cholesterol transport system auxiliary component